MGAFKKKFRNIKKFPTWVFWPFAFFLKFLYFIMRTEIQDPHHHMEKKDPVVTVTWHNRLLFFPVMFPRKVKKRTRAVVSASRDGQYVTDFISHFGLKSLRGSSSKKGANALRGAIKAIQEGDHVSFTPDGPRGPRYSMSRGPIQLASMTKRPVVPITINASSYWELKSWDRFQIPKPWAKLTLVLGEAIEIPSDLNDEELINWRETVRQKLMEITIDTQ